jgi:hypothetical protein
MCHRSWEAGETIGLWDAREDSCKVTCSVDTAGVIEQAISIAKQIETTFGQMGAVHHSRAVN